MSVILINPFILGGASDASVTKTDDSIDISNATTYTFTSQAIGTAAADRHVIVAVSYLLVGSGSSVSTVTIGGAGMTLVTQTTDHSGTENTDIGVAFYIASVTSGTTADVVVTLSASALRCGIGVWATSRLNSATATATASSGADPFNASIDVSAGGILVGYANSYDNAGGSVTFTWTNLTEQFDVQIESIFNAHTGASSDFATAQTALSVTCDPSQAVNTGAMILAAFR